MWQKTNERTQDGNMIYKNTVTGERAQECDSRTLVALPGERAWASYGNYWRIEQEYFKA